MKKLVFALAVSSIYLIGCGSDNHSHDGEHHEHSHEAEHMHDNEHGHDHDNHEHAHVEGVDQNHRDHQQEEFDVEKQENE